MGSITYLKVDGFRSLVDFRIILRPGLNVLVGPNGSGKSNFIDFLDFLNVLINNGAAMATSSAGGISRVFSQEYNKRSTLRVRISAYGGAELDSSSGRLVSLARTEQSRRTRYFRFHYRCEVAFNKSQSILYIAREDVLVSRIFDPNNRVLSPSTTYGRLSVRRRLTPDGLQVSWKLTESLAAISDDNPFASSIYSDRARNSLIEILNKHKEGEGDEPLDPDISICSLDHTGSALRAIRQAIGRGRSFNISPSRLRDLDDISHPPLIGRDGGGLSALLYELQALKNSGTGRFFSKEDRLSGALDEIVSWTKLVFPDLEDINVVADLHLGKYIPFLIMTNSLKIPFISASDGTLKWLCLSALLLTRNTSTTIEEPENYLHPKMQQFFIGLIREGQQDNHDRTFLMSTHSETVIDQCEPTELVVFDFNEGKTVARRIMNSSKLVEEIQRTGFGLGHYYVSNSIP